MVTHTTPEYRALQQLMHTICSSLSSAPDVITALATDLYEEQLISEPITRSVRGTIGVMPYNRASLLITAVQRAIKLNTSKFYVFVEKLDGHGFPEISQKLLKICGKFACVHV